MFQCILNFSSVLFEHNIRHWFWMNFCFQCCSRLSKLVWPYKGKHFNLLVLNIFRHYNNLLKPPFNVNIVSAHCTITLCHELRDTGAFQVYVTLKVNIMVRPRVYSLTKSRILVCFCTKKTAKFPLGEASC